MEKVDIAIIGAGVVGLAIAERLSGANCSLYVLERNPCFGQETSSRNSEVIHAGIYYPTGSLKARLCVEGNRLLYELCVKNEIPHKKIGKFIVAINPEEEIELQKIFKKAQENGVDGLKIITEKELKKTEPNVSAKCAIYSPDTGILDSHSLMKYFEEKIKGNKAEIAYNCKVIGLSKISDGYEVAVKDVSGEIFKFVARVVVNSAGLDSDTIAKMAGINIEKQDYVLKYCKGQYFRVGSQKKCALVNRLVYPVPHENAAGLGVHVTKDLAGGLRLGPDTCYVNRNNFDYEVDILKKKDFLHSALKFLPFLKEEDLTSDTAGIRPKLQGDGEDFRDFVIKEESGIGFPGLINLIGIESPGLTSAPAIARYVKAILK
ncbi:MAG: NAD(P)/FAD-dependent oxidoreductase [Candidatus Omnitrophota bacterium]